jgi:hypothetical protein
MHFPLLSMSLVMIIMLLVMIMNLSQVNFTKKTSAMIKGLMKQEEILVEERKSNEELKKLLPLENGKVEKLDQEFAQNMETTSSLKSSIGALRDQHGVLQKTHQDLEVQFDAL